MMMDMRKGPNCGAPHKIHAIGISAAAAGDAAVAGAYIEGFGGTSAAHHVPFWHFSDLTLESGMQTKADVRQPP